LSRPATQQANIEPVLRWAFMGAILITTGIGFVLGSSLTPILEEDMSLLLLAAFLVIASGQIIVTRYVVLPGVIANPTPDKNPAAIAYGFAEAPATYGLVLAIMAGEGWMALPLGGVALVGWQIMRSYLAAREAAVPEDFPTL
jgi:hypothetical protein